MQIKSTEVVRANRVKVRVHLREIAQLVQQGDVQPRRVREIENVYYLQHCPSGWKLAGSDAVSEPVDNA
jgi:hypothetical protein